MRVRVFHSSYRSHVEILKQRSAWSTSISHAESASRFLARKGLIAFISIE